MLYIMEIFNSIRLNPVEMVQQSMKIFSYSWFKSSLFIEK